MKPILKLLLLIVILSPFGGGLGGWNTLSAQVYYFKQDTLKASDSIHTFALDGKYEYITVTAIDSGGSVTDSLLAYNIFGDTTRIAVKKLSTNTDGEYIIPGAGLKTNFFLWDPYIQTLQIARINKVWTSGWRTILIIKGILRW